MLSLSKASPEARATIAVAPKPMPPIAGRPDIGSPEDNHWTQVPPGTSSLAIHCRQKPSRERKHCGKRGHRQGMRRATNLLQALDYSIPEDLATLQPIPTDRTASKMFGVYRGRKTRWQAQLWHESIGGYASAWEAGVAVAARLVVLARAEAAEDERQIAS